MLGCLSCPLRPPQGRRTARDLWAVDLCSCPEGGSDKRSTSQGHLALHLLVGIKQYACVGSESEEAALQWACCCPRGLSLPSTVPCKKATSQPGTVTTVCRHHVCMLHAPPVCMSWSAALQLCYRTERGVSRLPRPQAQRLVTGPLCSHQALGAVHSALPSPTPPPLRPGKPADTLEATKGFGAWRIGVGGARLGSSPAAHLLGDTRTHSVLCLCTTPLPVPAQPHSPWALPARVYGVQMARVHHDL